MPYILEQNVLKSLVLTSWVHILNFCIKRLPWEYTDLTCLCISESSCASSLRTAPKYLCSVVYFNLLPLIKTSGIWRSLYLLGTKAVYSDFFTLYVISHSTASGYHHCYGYIVYWFSIPWSFPNYKVMGEISILRTSGLPGAWGGPHVGFTVLTISPLAD